MGKTLGKHPNFDVCLCDDKLAMKQNHLQMPHFPSSQSHSSWKSCNRDQSFCHPSPLCSCFPCPAWDGTAASESMDWRQRKVPVGLLESALTWFSFTGKSSGAAAHGHLSPKWCGFGYTQASPRPSHLPTAKGKWRYQSSDSPGCLHISLYLLSLTSKVHEQSLSSLITAFAAGFTSKYQKCLCISSIFLGSR